MDWQLEYACLVICLPGLRSTQSSLNGGAMIPNDWLRYMCLYMQLLHWRSLNQSQLTDSHNKSNCQLTGWSDSNQMAVVECLCPYKQGIKDL
ncbi:hypothetical protein XELAEV_18018763mg [Xenopus laevis]|uniref:Uncharacterized protein n=1 Tax=Xenopus laevis TaxID=8355 RepID=A0A974DFK1_XENLA|nr:hypothetical protein XELAEV_18018763mg [Xenopus laevis]